ncbi:SPOR domain-containing protein, partial [Pararhodospirillum oryzae]|uniref:SPOR domain-containing protein n=1 Tax=Pararhodospirillum oryzae TaxID=478448 RepID=UPI0011BE0299
PAAAQPAPAPAPAPAPSSTARGAYSVQFVALRTPEDAEAVWRKMVEQHRDLIGSLQHEIVRADLGSKGVFYRLRAKGLASKADAKTLCDALVARGQGCILVR